MEEMPERHDGKGAGRRTRRNAYVARQGQMRRRFTGSEADVSGKGHRLGCLTARSCVATCEGAVKGRICASTAFAMPC